MTYSRFTEENFFPEQAARGRKIAAALRASLEEFQRLRGMPAAPAVVPRSGAPSPPWTADHEPPPPLGGRVGVGGNAPVTRNGGTAVLNGLLNGRFRVGTLLGTPSVADLDEAALLTLLQESLDAAADLPREQAAAVEAALRAVIDSLRLQLEELERALGRELTLADLPADVLRALIEALGGVPGRPGLVVSTVTVPLFPRVTPRVPPSFIGWDPKDVWAELSNSTQKKWNALAACCWKIVTEAEGSVSKNTRKDLNTNDNINIGVNSEEWFQRFLTGDDVQWEHNEWAVDWDKQEIWIDKQDDDKAAALLASIIRKLSCERDKKTNELRGSVLPLTTIGREPTDEFEFGPFAPRDVIVDLLTRGKLTPRKARQIHVFIGLKSKLFKNLVGVLTSLYATVWKTLLGKIDFDPGIIIDLLESKDLKDRIEALEKLDRLRDEAKKLQEEQE